MAQFPSRIQAALLFDVAHPLDMDALVREFLAAEEGTGTHYKLVYDTKPGVFYRLFGTNHVMITVEHVDRQAQLPLFEAALSSPFTNMGTPDARERLARHSPISSSKRIAARCRRRQRFWACSRNSGCRRLDTRWPSFACA